MFSTHAVARDYGKDIEDFGVDHIDGVILNEDSMMPDKKTLESEEYLGRIKEAYDFLDRQFKDRGLYFNVKRRKSYVMMKEKFGELRIDGTILDSADEKVFRSAILLTLKEYPEFAPYLQVNPCDRAILFTGTEKQFVEWKSGLKKGDLEAKLKNMLEHPLYRTE